MQKGDILPPLIDAQNPARLAGNATVEIRRELNGLFGRERHGRLAVATFLAPGPSRRPMKEEEMDDLSDDELWESLRHPLGVPRAELKRRTLGDIVMSLPRGQSEATDSSRPTSASSSRIR